eukprot:GHUV01008301.1.p1 GENE.GHUV01008301.1~~GHUV01008301.1.p1  ORF type:complete len:549 (+),score=91.58 GHUV01008301.1:280-1926(+)
MSRTALLLLVWACAHHVVPGPVAGQGFSPSSPTVGASGGDNQLQQQYESSRAWRRSYKFSPKSACSSKNGASLCGAAVNVSADAYAQLMLATSPQVYSSMDPKWTGGVRVVAPAGDQKQCQTCAAFAVASAAETSMASVLHVDVTECSISMQSLYFCPQHAPARTCDSGWDLPTALTQLQDQGQSLPTAGCLPYTPDFRMEYDRQAMCSGSCNSTSKYASQGQFITAKIGIIWKAQLNIRHYGSVVTRFDVYDDFKPFFNDPSNAQAVYRPRHGAQLDFLHTVVLVGYDNIDQYWIAKNSWGSTWGDSGFFKVAYGECSVLTAGTGEAYGVTWKVNGNDTLPAFKLQNVKLQVDPGPKPGCYLYKARVGDYLSKIASLAGIPLDTFMLDNTPYVKDLDAPLEGTTLLLCNPLPGSIYSASAPLPAVKLAPGPNPLTKQTGSTIYLRNTCPADDILAAISYAVRGEWRNLGFWDLAYGQYSPVALTDNRVFVAWAKGKHNGHPVWDGQHCFNISTLDDGSVTKRVQTVCGRTVDTMQRTWGNYTYTFAC